MAKTKYNFDQLPLFTPDSNWTVPEQLPDLSQELEVAIDTETRDDLLGNDMGPGHYAYPNSGFICGISLAWRDSSAYIPLRHYETNCFDYNTVRNWLNQLANQSWTRFIFHNFQYDWGWLQAVFNIPPPAKLDDTAAMASMLNENLSSFSLDSLCAWQGLPGKDETLLMEALSNYRVKEKDAKKHLWQVPARYVAPYAEQDAVSTLKLAQKLRILLTEEDLDSAYQIERDLMPVTLKMKQRGVRVDVARAAQLSNDIIQQCEDKLSDLGKKLGHKVSINELRHSRWLKEQFDRMDLTYPRTGASDTYADGQASFEKNFMANHQHWFPRTVHKIKHQYDLADKFLKKFILKYAHNGRVYPTVNQFQSEDGGTRSHRFSYSDPPLQQMPSRDDEYAPLIRSCFIPEDGEFWCSIDYRQQEFRLIVFASEILHARGAALAANRYRNIPNTDFHDYVASITRLPRKQAKDANFAKAYGAGVKKFALMTGMGEEEARKIMEQYDNELPFVRLAAEQFSRKAADRGYIKMIDGARGHFNLLEPVYRDFALEYEAKKKNSSIHTTPCFEEEANRRRNDQNHPWQGERMRRAFTHKAFNRFIQGSAARQIKKAMVDLYKAGYQPVLQIHDELCFSLKDKKDAKICAKIMEQAVPIITIPMPVDIKYGSSWGTLEKEKDNDT